MFVHPGFPPHTLPLAQHPVWLYEFPFETVRAITQAASTAAPWSATRDPLQLSHLGGAAPFLAPPARVAGGPRAGAGAAAAPAGALAYLRRLYYDTGLSNNAPALAATREVTALDHIVFGTDWPYAALPPQGGDPAPDLDVLGDHGRMAVEAENVAALVPRLVGART